jgi:hypothetical protein
MTDGVLTASLEDGEERVLALARARSTRRKSDKARPWDLGREAQSYTRSLPA